MTVEPKQPKTGVEDSLELESVGGTPYHTGPSIGAGFHTNVPKGGVEDNHELFTAGGKILHSGPPLGVGSVFGKIEGIEDDLYYLLQNDGDPIGWGDLDPPELQDLNPYDGEVNVLKDDNFFLRIKDYDSDLNVSSVSIDVERGSGWEEVWKSGAQQSGFSVTENVIADNEVTYDVNPDVDFTAGITVQVRVRAYDEALTPNLLDQIYTYEIFDKDKVFTVTHLSDFQLEVSSSIPLKTTGAPGVALADPASYSMKSKTGYGYPSGTFQPTAVYVDSSTSFRLTLSNYTTVDEEYRLTVLGALETITNLPLIGAISDWISDNSRPYVTQIVPTSARTVEVTFSRDMLDNDDLINPSAYVFTGGIRAEVVEKVNATKVVITTNAPLVSGAEYLISVKANP